MICIGLLSLMMSHWLKGFLECRYADILKQAHDEEHLAKFEDLLEAAIDLDRIPDEYLICSSYDSGLQVCKA